MNKDLLKLLTEGWLRIDNSQQRGINCNHPTLSCTECLGYEKCDKLDGAILPEELEYLHTHHPELFI